MAVSTKESHSNLVWISLFDLHLPLCYILVEISETQEYNQGVREDNGKRVISTPHSSVQLLYSVIQAIVLCRSRRCCRLRILKSLLKYDKQNKRYDGTIYNYVIYDRYCNKTGDKKPSR